VQLVFILKVAVVLGGIAEMRIMLTLRRTEPERLAVSMLPIGCVWSPATAPGFAAETTLANNVSNPTICSPDRLGGARQLSNAATSTTVSTVSNSC
jgi:hypothetical protein